MRALGITLSCALASACTPAPAPTSTAAATPTSTSASTSQATPTSAPPAAAQTDPAWLSPAPSTPAPPMPSSTRWIALGAVDGPWSNQLSIEDELRAVQDRLGPDGGVVLYAGGAGRHGVQVADAAPRGPALMARLGEIIDPRAGRDAHYEPLHIAPHGPGTRGAFVNALTTALQEDGPRLLVWIAGHGAPGETPADVGLADWMGDGLGVADVRDAFGAPRPLRLVQTTCFGGGFAEAVLAHPTRTCGLFATTWDLEASGCDPDPERARESYGALVLRALGDRANDLDGDGVVGLSEAHVKAAIEAPGFEVPLLSSQAFLDNELGELRADIDRDAPLLWEERAIVRTILSRLAIEEADLEPRFEALVTQEGDLVRVRADFEDAAADAAHALRAELFERWPALEDPWHPDFAGTMTGQGPSIESFLETSPSHQRWRTQLALADVAAANLDAHKVLLAPFDRALIALRTMQRAAFAAQGKEGSTWATFETLRRCEREGLP